MSTQRLMDGAIGAENEQSETPLGSTSSGGSLTESTRSTALVVESLFSNNNIHPTHFVEALVRVFHRWESLKQTPSKKLTFGSDAAIIRPEHGRPPVAEECETEWYRVTGLDPLKTHCPYNDAAWCFAWGRFRRDKEPQRVMYRFFGLKD